MTRDTVRDELAYLRDEASELFESYLARPLLRGISHLIGSITAMGASLVLILQSAALLQTIASIVYGAGLAAALGVSALYHRIKWRPRAYQRIRKLDHSMIYVLIACSATPFALLAMDGAWRIAAVAFIWTLALAGISLRWFVENQPRWLMVATYIGMGWAMVALLPGLLQMSTTAFTLTVIGGALYTIGGLVYLFQRPNPLPKIFGFHEVFHAFVVAAAACHFLAVWPLVTSPHAL